MAPNAEVLLHEAFVGHPIHVARGPTVTEATQCRRVPEREQELGKHGGRQGDAVFTTQAFSSVLLTLLFAQRISTYISINISKKINAVYIHNIASRPQVLNWWKEKIKSAFVTHVMMRVSSPGSPSTPSTNRGVFVKLYLFQKSPSSKLNLGRKTTVTQDSCLTIALNRFFICSTE